MSRQDFTSGSVMTSRSSSERRRFSVALQQVYAALIEYSTACDDIPGSAMLASDTLLELADMAVRAGSIPPQARGLIQSCFMLERALLQDDRQAMPGAAYPGESVSGVNPSDQELLGSIGDDDLRSLSRQLSSLAHRIEGQMRVGDVTDLAAPVVLNGWTPLPKTLSALVAAGGRVAVRDDDGYCVSVSLADAGAWLMQTPSPLPDPSMVSASDLVGLAPDDWAAVDRTVEVSKIEQLLSDPDASVSAVLVFANEDYTGDPVGMVCAQTLLDWRRKAEHRRYGVIELLNRQLNGPAPPEGIDEAQALGGALAALADSLGLGLLFIDDASGVALALLVALAGSGRGATLRELFDILIGRRTAGLTARGLCNLPVFGCAPDIFERTVSLELAGLLSAGLVRQSPYSSSILLSEDCLKALAQPDPEAAISKLLAASSLREEVVYDAR